MEKLKKYFFFFTIFTSGAVILIIEILGTRILAPFYGSTIFVWSSLITVTMAFLAFGYFFGGKIADKKADIDLLYWVIFIAGILILAIPEYERWILIRSDNFGLKYGPLISAFILFAPSLFLLGMVSPFAVKIKTQTLTHLGMTAGNLYALATFGSLFGALLTGFYLAPYFPAALILMIAGLFLIFLFLVWQILNLKKIR